MGTRVRLRSCSIVVTASVLGCNALTGVGELAVDHEATSSSGEVTTPAHGSASSSSGSSGGTSIGAASSGSSPSASSSSGDVDAGADGNETAGEPPIAVQSFTTASACVGATVIGDATASFEPNGRTGGACIVCATTAGETYIELTATSAEAMRVGYEAYARRVAGASGPSAATAQLGVGGVSVSTSSAISDTWKQLSAGSSVSVQSGAAISLRVGMKSAAIGECIVIDDLAIKRL